MWLAGFLYAFVYTYAWTLPAHALLTRGQSEGPPGHLAPMSNIPMDVYLTVGGLALLMAAPWLTAGVAALDVRAAQALLGPSRAEELEHRVERLTQTRAGVSTLPTPSGAAWSGTCTTAPSSGWSPWP